MIEAFLAPSFSFIVINDIGVESNTASNTEHKNETDSANNRYNMTNSIYEDLPMYLYRNNEKNDFSYYVVPKIFYISINCE